MEHQHKFDVHRYATRPYQPWNTRAFDLIYRHHTTTARPKACPAFCWVVLRGTIERLVIVAEGRETGTQVICTGNQDMGFRGFKI